MKGGIAIAESILICRHNKNGTGYCEHLSSYCVEGPCTAEELIEYAPVRHGRWERVIPTKSAAKWSTKVSCSQCHGQGYERYNYCPHCGALMDKEE